jgi:hypothetical protein
MNNDWSCPKGTPHLSHGAFRFLDDRRSRFCSSGHFPMIPFFLAESNNIADIVLGTNPLGSLIAKVSANSRNVDFGSV